MLSVMHACSVCKAQTFACFGLLFNIHGAEARIQCFGPPRYVPATSHSPLKFQCLPFSPRWRPCLIKHGGRPLGAGHIVPKAEVPLRVYATIQYSRGSLHDWTFPEGTETDTHTGKTQSDRLCGRGALLACPEAQPGAILLLVLPHIRSSTNMFLRSRTW